MLPTHISSDKALHTNADRNIESPACLFIEANRRQNAGDFRSAFRLFKLAASNGHISSMNSLGYAFDIGIGTRKNKKKAMFWYKKAARRGDLCAYTNIGTIYRDHKNLARARFWFSKAFKRGDGDAALEIGKLYMRDKQRWKQTEKFLRLALRAKNVTEDSKKEAANLLKDIKRCVS